MAAPKKTDAAAELALVIGFMRLSGAMDNVGKDLINPIADIIDNNMKEVTEAGEEKVTGMLSQLLQKYNKQGELNKFKIQKEKSGLEWDEFMKSKQCAQLFQKIVGKNPN